MNEPIEAEVTQLTTRHESPLAITQGTPTEIIERATEIADVLKRVIRDQGLFKRIRDRDHVLVEGWTTLGAMVGVFPQIEWSRQVLDPDNEVVGWEARCLVTMPNGNVVSAAEAECMKSESTWKGRDDYALRSMAQTRAVSKAMRLPLSWVMTLAGFDATPAEEMPAEAPQTQQPNGTQRPAPPQPAESRPDTDETYLRRQAVNAFGQLRKNLGDVDAASLVTDLGATVMPNGNLDMGKLTTQVSQDIINMAETKA